MQAIKGLVVAALLAVWCFPAVSLAKPEPAAPPALPQVVTSRSAGTAAAETTGAMQGAASSEAAQLAQREQQAQDLQNYRGGEGVYIYLGSGVLVVLVVILLILLI